MRKQELNNKINKLSNNTVYELFKALLAASTNEVTFIHHWENAIEGFTHWEFIKPIWDKWDLFQESKFNND